MIKSFFKSIYDKYKKILMLLKFSVLPLYCISLYLVMMFRHFNRTQNVCVNVITLCKDIPKFGFPFLPSLGVLLLLIGSLIFMIWKGNQDIFKEDERNFKYSDSGVYGTAGLLQESELDGFAKVNTPEEAEGTILGQMDETGKRLINIDENSRLNKHIAVFGASGTGKSRCFARPFIIQAVKKRESIIVTDPKGELYESTAQYMRDNGYIVKIFNLVHPEKSDSWDCLRELRGDEIRAQIFANTVIENTGDSNDIWATSAMSLLKALLLRVKLGKDYEKSNKQSIGEAYSLIQNPRGEEFLDEMFDLDPKYYSKEERRCIGPYMTFKQASPNMRGNIITGLATRMQVFQNEVIRKITAKPDIDLTLPAQRPCAYYVIMSDQHSAMNFLSSLFFSLAFIDLVEYADAQPNNHCQVPVNLLLDEFPNIGSIPDFEKKIATVRSRHINIAMIFQGITQLQERYPFGKWTSILGNCDTHLFLGCNEQDTAKFISDRTGETTVKVKTEQHEKNEPMFIFGRNHSTGDGKRKIMTPDEVMRLNPNQEIIIFRGMNVLMAHKYDFSLHPEAEKFKVCRIADRPSINDERGRKAMLLQDEKYLKAYETRRRQEEETRKVQESKTEIGNKKNKFDFFKKKTKKTTDKDEVKSIRPCEDIELEQDEYTEIVKESVSVAEKKPVKKAVKKSAAVVDLGNISMDDIVTIDILAEKEVPIHEEKDFDFTLYKQEQPLIKKKTPPVKTETLSNTNNLKNRSDGLNNQNKLNSEQKGSPIIENIIEQAYQRLKKAS